jgi:hypothetical protein
MRRLAPTGAHLAREWSRACRIAGYARRPAMWRTAARMLAWEVAERSAPPQSTPLTWPLDANTRSRITVSWPERYAQANAHLYVDPILRGMASHVDVVRTSIAQHEGNLVLFDVTDGVSTLRGAIDYDDLPDLHASVSACDVYFKLQYRRGGYDLEHVVPGGYVSTRPALYRHAARWRRLRESPFRFDVFGRFGLRYNAETRRRVLEAMSRQSRLRFAGGSSPTSWHEYMDDMARSAVSLDLPGRGPLCYRLVEALAVGGCVVGPELDAELHVPLNGCRIPADVGDLVETCEKLVGDGARRDMLSAAAGDYFDRYLRPEQLGGYYLHTCLALL